MYYLIHILEFVKKVLVLETTGVEVAIYKNHTLLTLVTLYLFVHGVLTLFRLQIKPGQTFAHL